MLISIGATSWNLGGRKVTGRLIVPSAREIRHQATRSLDLETAAQLVFTSGTCFNIVSISHRCSMGLDLLNRKDSFLNPEELQARVNTLLTGADETRTVYTLINTSRCVDAEEAVANALLAYDCLDHSTTLIKLEVYDASSRAPNDREVLRAAQRLSKERPELELMPFVTKNGPLTQELVQNHRVVALRVLGSPIGSNQGLGDEKEFRRVVEAADGVPVIAEGGLGTATHVRRARENGATACLVNYAIATYQGGLSAKVAFVNELRAASELRFPFERSAGAPKFQLNRQSVAVGAF
jgi:thiazole synthase ThiGH ThiG subunit